MPEATAPPFSPDLAEIPLFDALLLAARRGGGSDPVLEDLDRKPLAYRDIIRAAFALGGRLRRMSEPRERVGLLLPTSAGMAVAFFALQAIGRTPTLLNFTSGALNLRAACAGARVRRVLTSRRFVEQAGLGPMLEELQRDVAITFLEDVREEIGLSDKLGALAAAAAPELFRAPWSPEEPACILFTSGSFGAPRGVALSHRNLMSNVRQIEAHIALGPNWLFFNPLPMFHALGLMASLIPLLTGRRLFAYPSPLHFKEVVRLSAETGADLLFGTDTFAQQYARAAKDGELASLTFMVCGAERVREETRRLYDGFGVTLLEGYGATEASPVIALNQPNANRPGTVGKLLPAIEVRLDPVEGIGSGARLLVRGPNVMLGYLGEDGRIEPPRDGWHDTGDLVRLDPEGFLSIQGRVKRFAKIGGEMVSLAAVEGYASALWPMARHAAVALSCNRRGERVILVTDKTDAEVEDLRAWAQANGAPEIALPKLIVKTDEIPVLGSGKTDYVAVQDIASREAETARAA